MSRRYGWLNLLIVCMALFGGLFFFNGKVYGASKEELYKRADANNLMQCFNSSVLAPEISLEETGSFSIDNIVIGGDYKGLYTPSGHNSDDIQLSCNQFLTGTNEKNVFSEFGQHNPGSSFASAKDFLGHFGYKEYDTGYSGEKCYSFYSGKSGKIGEDGNKIFDFCLDDKQGSSGGVVTKYKEIAKKPEWLGMSCDQNGCHWSFNEPREDGYYAHIECNWSYNAKNAVCGDDLLRSWEVKEHTAKTAKYVIPSLGNPDYAAAYGVARNWLTGKSAIEPFSDADIIDLYNSYLSEYGMTSASGECQENKPNQIVDRANNKYYVYGKGGWCPKSFDEKVMDAKFAGFVIDSRSKYIYLNKIMSFEELLEDLAYWAGRNPNAAENSKPSSDSKNPDGGEDLCYESAGPMGWILCPAIVATSGAGNYMWEQIEQYLQIKPSDITNSSVNEGWEAMRTIANIIFIILFMFVIFSQLTGVGIDNYGIKKILPKLIVIAILINLSLVLCQVAVDLSNIVGAGIKNLLSAGAGTISSVQTIGDTTMVVGGSQALIVAGVAVAAIFVHLKGAKELLGAVAIGILGAIVVVIIAILVMYLILTVRQAAIILLMVLAPVAIVCYALPNTEKFFKKWADIFKALLIVYPICGAMVGAGLFARSVLGESNPLMAMIVAVVPYFFVPVLLKNSLNAMGNLGGKISSLGRTFGKRSSGAATGAIRNSERYKDFQQYNSSMMARKRAQRISDNLAGRTDLSARQQNRVRKAHEVLAAGSAQDAADRNRSQESYLEASRVAAEKKFKDEEVENYMSLVNSQTRNGDDETELYKLFDEAVNSGNESMAVAIARIAGRRADTARRFANKKFSNNSAMEGHQDLFRTVAKEMATGANSGNYRQSSPFDFEYASQVNKDGYGKTGGYSTWSRTKNSDGMTGMSAALDHHVGKTSELMAMKKDALKDIRAAMDSDAITTTEKEQLRDLAQATIRARDEGRDNGTFDYNKAKEIEDIANWTPRDGVDIVHNSQ